MFKIVDVTSDFIYYTGLHDTRLNPAVLKDSYRIPNTIGSLRELYRITKDETVLSYGKIKREQRDNNLKLKMKKDCEGDPRLRPYQRVDISYLKTLPHGGGIFNDMRTGKTPTVLVLVKELAFKKVGIIVPANVIKQWEDEIKKWTGREDIYVLHGTKRKKRMEEMKEKDSFIFLTTYHTLSRDINQFDFTLDCVVADEIHRVKSRGRKSAKNSNIVNALFEISVKAKKKYALTGTPAVRCPSDLWVILHFINPKGYPSYWQFCERYMETRHNYFSGDEEVTGRIKYLRRKEFEELITSISTQRKRHEVMSWLPEKEYVNVPLNMEPKQKKIYENILNHFSYNDPKVGELEVLSELEQIAKLRQICLDPRTIDLKANGIKTKWVLDFLEDFRGKPVLFMSVHTSYLKLLKQILHKQGFRSGEIHGEITSRRKLQYVQDFQSGRLDILLCNIKSAGVGLQLDRAGTVVFLDLEWNPSDNQQAEDRIVPVSEERNHSLTVYRLFLKNTVDEHVWRINSHKKDITEIVKSGGLKALEKIAEELAE